jgi:ubiquinone/menaquinone biosynthesis C-methylase UbiE
MNIQNFKFKFNNNQTYYNLSTNVSGSSEYGGNTLEYIRQGYLYATCFQQLINYVRVIKQIKKNDEVLDVGCGQAELLTLMRSNRLSNFYAGIEVNDYNLKKAQKLFKKSNREILIKQDVSLGLPFIDNSFDIVTCNLVLEHLPKIESFLLFNELIRVCKENGKILIMMPIREDGQPNSQKKHIYEWTMQDIDNQIKANKVIVKDKYLAAVTIRDILKSQHKDVYKQLKGKIHPIFIRMMMAPMINTGTDIYLSLVKTK